MVNSAAADNHQAALFAEFLLSHPDVVVLTGAGISAGSGIPTYRNKSGEWLGSQPIQHSEFVNDERRRKHYWARSSVGWPAVSSAEPNPTHLALVALEQLGLVRLLVTQNVDRLHQKAGHRQVVDLHGRLDQVICLSCNTIESRETMQSKLISLNPDLNKLSKLATTLAPDGDAAVDYANLDQLKIPKCNRCGGVLKPHVVFFGGAVPRERVEQVSEAVTACRALVVIGSSLMVYSSYRFCLQAQSLGIPVVILNQGITRADELATLKLDIECAATLTAAVNAVHSSGLPGIRS